MTFQELFSEHRLTKRERRELWAYLIFRRAFKAFEKGPK